MFLFDVPAGWLALLNPYWVPLNLLLIGSLPALVLMTWRRGAAGVAGVAFVLPLYVARTRFGFFPTTYLELALLTVAGTWLVRQRWTPTTPRAGADPLRGPALALLGAATFALLWSPDIRAAAGLWKAYLVEPLLFYAVARQNLGTKRDRWLVGGALLASGSIVAAAALWQWFSGIGIATSGWVLPESRRVTGWFTSPNAVGLFLGPAIAVAAGWWTDHRLRRSHRLALTTTVLVGLAAVAATRSAGTWLGLAVAAGIIGWRTLPRGRRAVVAASLLLIFLALPAGRSRLVREFTDAGADNRIALWRGTLGYLTASPAHFLTGAGIAGFANVHEQLRDPRRSEPLIYPHHIALNIWMEYGIAGLLAAGWLAWRIIRTTRLAPATDGLALGVTAALGTIVGHGLVDVPYFKNDLAVLTWLLLALLNFSVTPSERQPQA